MPSTAAAKSKIKKMTKKVASPKKTAIARRAPEAASDSLVSARGAAQTGLKRAQKVVKDHPLASVGTLIGAGVLVGVAANRAMRHSPSVGEVVADALSLRANKASKSLANSARKSIKKATSSVRRALK